jgi:hypothetical protein
MRDLFFAKLKEMGAGVPGEGLPELVVVQNELNLT